MNVGILALQGSFVEHAEVLKKMGVNYVLVRDKKSLEGITHLIIPGGESTTMTKLLTKFGMWDFLVQQITEKKINIFGTCAGAILISRLFPDAGFTVERNAYGGQQGSFVTVLASDLFPASEGVFIRAPRIIVEDSSKLEILASYGETPVLVKGDGFWAMSFHPELSDEGRIHQAFLKETY